MTERGEESLIQTKDQLKIGPSSFSWEKDKLVIRIDEIATPHLDRVYGKITIKPKAITEVEVCLTPDGAHVWRPFAPNAEIEVDIKKKGWNWKGHGYFDANFGTRALEQDFSYWTWGRFPDSNGSFTFYDAALRNKKLFSAALRFKNDGTVEEISAPPEAKISRSLWAVKRKTRCDLGYKPKQIKHMLDAPFYTRSAVRTKLYGEELTGVHEALDLDRFASPLLKPIIALRVPRTTRWKSDD